MAQQRVNPGLLTAQAIVLTLDSQGVWDFSFLFGISVMHMNIRELCGSCLMHSGSTINSQSMVLTTPFFFFFFFCNISVNLVKCLWSRSHTSISVSLLLLSHLPPPRCPAVPRSLSPSLLVPANHCCSKHKPWCRKRKSFIFNL